MSQTLLCETQETAVQTERLTFPGCDGTPLNYKAWLPAGPFTRAILLLHRGHEHADRWDDTAPSLLLPETAVFAWEARGHGQSPGQRGHAPGFMTYVRDLECFTRHLMERHDLRHQDLAVIAHSVGAVVAAAWVHDYAPPLAALVLATPAFEVKLYVPGALTGCRWLAKLNRSATIKSYVRGSWLTRDAAEARKYDADHAISRDISASILVDLFDTSHRVIADAAVMEAPLLLLSAGQDRVVKNSAHERFFRNYGGIREGLLLPRARHDIFHDLCRGEVTTVIRRFIHRQFARPEETISGGESTVTRNEFASLNQTLPLLSPRRAWYALQRASMATLGRLSKGIRLGWETGFDSGESLNYVYDSQPRGISPLGRWFDRSYLNAIGWRGIRQRRELLREAIQQTLREASSGEKSLRVVDIAGGAGRYLLDTLQDSHTPSGLRILCRDWSESALATGRASAEALGLQSRISFERGDAFDEVSLAALSPQTQIAIVSGLYELFPDNERLERSLRGLNRALKDGGWLIYTNQPWHPQVETIARVLINRDQKPWIMRRRPQREMDGLVDEAGFEKTGQWTDDFGIFTVAVARKRKG